MSAVIDHDTFRLFRNAADLAKRLGMQQREAVHAVSEARRQGMTGQHVAGQLQHRAMRKDRGPQPPAAA